MFRIRKLDLFISKQFGLLFVGTFFICQFVLMMQFLWRYVDELIGKGLSIHGSDASTAGFAAGYPALFTDHIWKPR